MRILSFLSTILIALMLTACGGGGGSSGANPNRPNITTTAPAVLGLPLGVVSEYSVRGGVGPYRVSTSNPRVVDVSLSGGTFWINTVGQGTATVTLLDNNTGSTAISVTVGDQLKLSASNLKSYVGDQIKVQITGGTPPFRASTIDTAVTAVVNGRELLLNLQALGKVDVVVIDALNQQAIVNVEVIAGSPQFALTPAAQTVSENSTEAITLRVIGGVGALSVKSSDTNLFKASISGNLVTLTTGVKGDRCIGDGDGNVTITVIDSRGGFATAVVTLQKNPAGCGLQVSSKNVSVLVGESVKLVLFGMTDSGTISISSADATKATATYSNGVITIQGLVSTFQAEVPAGCTVPAPAPLDPPIPPGQCYVNAGQKPITLTVVDSGPPTRSVNFDVTVLPK